MATNITTDNLLGQFCSLINTNAAGVANVDDLLIYKYSGGSLQRITAQLMRDYFLAGLNSQMSGYATQNWVSTRLLSYVDVATFNALQAVVNQIANVANQAAAAAVPHVFLAETAYAELVANNEVDPDVTYLTYEG